jgi:hypothetical protein
MNQKLILKIVFCLVFIFCTASFAAEKTYNFSYSGILKDAEGNLITGNKTITFHIGSWSETQNITITEGIYSTLLGIQTPLTKDVFEESDFLLEIMIDGESLKPDTEILPVRTFYHEFRGHLTYFFSLDLAFVV